MKRNTVGANYIAKQRVRKQEVVLLNHVHSEVKSVVVNAQCRVRRAYHA